MKSTVIVLIFVVCSSFSLHAAEYEVKARYPIAGTEGWDYITVDSAARRLYVSHAVRVNVLNADTGAAIGTIEDTPGVHGIAVAGHDKHGFTSNGKENKVSMFDTKTLAIIKKIEVGKGPDGIYYDKASNRVFTNNHGSHDITAIDGASGAVVGTVAVNGNGEARRRAKTGSFMWRLRTKMRSQSLTQRALR